MFWNFFFYFFPFIPSHKTPGAWSSRWKAELVLIFIFDYILCLKRQEAAEVAWIPAPFWNPSFLQNALSPPTLETEVRNYSLSPPIVTAGTTDAAGSQSTPDGLFISTSLLRSSSHQPEKQVQAEIRGQSGHKEAIPKPCCLTTDHRTNIWYSKVYPVFMKEQQNISNQFHLVPEISY